MVEFPTFPHLPLRGDPDRQITYMAVGRLIDHWEGVEFELSRTFSATMGHPDGRVMPFYGEKGRIFRERMNILKLAVDHHFIVAPNQQLEARFDKLVEDVTWYSDRRNDVAHTVVYDLSDLAAFMSLHPEPPNRPHHFAVPPVYAFTRREQTRGLTPPFALSSAELGVLADCMTELHVECRRFRHDLFPNEWPEERLSP